MAGKSKARSTGYARRLERNREYKRAKRAKTFERSEKVQAVVRKVRAESVKIEDFLRARGNRHMKDATAYKRAAANQWAQLATLKKKHKDTEAALRTRRSQLLRVQRALRAAEAELSTARPGHQQWTNLLSKLGAKEKRRVLGLAKHPWRGPTAPDACWGGGQ